MLGSGTTPDIIISPSFLTNTSKLHSSYQTFARKWFLQHIKGSRCVFLNCFSYNRIRGKTSFSPRELNQLRSPALQAMVGCNIIRIWTCNLLTIRQKLICANQKALLDFHFGLLLQLQKALLCVHTFPIALSFNFVVLI